MRTAIAELVLTAARTVLANVAAGRIYDPETVQWARFINAANRESDAHQSRARPRVSEAVT